MPEYSDRFKPDVRNVPTPEEVNFYHLASDKDSGPGALHHTLGLGPSQASPGNHNHDGRNSKRVELKNLDGANISFQVAGGTTGTQPTFSGTPLFTGSYTKWGNMCHFQIDVDMDNITSFGTGQYYMDLPFVSSFSYQFADGCLHDISANRDYPIFGHVMKDSNRLYLKSIDAHANSAYNVPFEQGLPITLSTADNFHIAGPYEIKP
jgi:hypothetical protein